MAGDMRSLVPTMKAQRHTLVLHRSQLVEFVGLPGSGKTTIARRTAQHLQDRGEIVNLLMVSSNSGRLERARKQQVALSYLALRHPEQLLSSLAAFNALPPASPATRMRLHVNWCLHLAHWYRSGGAPGIHLLDQGLFQVMWSLGFEYGPAAVEMFHARSRQDYPAPTVVVLVTASEDRLRTSLQERGGQNAFTRASDGSSDLDTIHHRGRAALEAVAGLVTAQKRLRLITVDNENYDSLEQSSHSLAVELQRLVHATRGSESRTGPSVVDV